MLREVCQLFNRGVQSWISRPIWVRFGRGFGLGFGRSKTSKSDFNFDIPRFRPDFDGFDTKHLSERKRLPRRSSNYRSTTVCIGYLKTVFKPPCPFKLSASRLLNQCSRHTLQLFWQNPTFSLIPCLLLVLVLLIQAPTTPLANQMMT